MRDKMFSNKGNEGGFLAAEMIMLLAMLVVFLVGVVALAMEGVDTVQPAGGKTRLADEGTRLLDRIEALAHEAQVVALRPTESERGPRSEGLLFAADLDGSGGTFVELEDGSRVILRGLQVVDIFQGSPRGLTAVIKEDEQSTDRVVLSDMLDRDDPPAFSVDYLLSGGRRAEMGEVPPRGLSIDSIKVKVRLRSAGESRTFSRVIRLETPALAAKLPSPVTE